MNILALEFSAACRSVAVVACHERGKFSLLGSAVELHAKSIRPLKLIQHALDQARLKPVQIGCVAVGLGPGSYTGIRSSIAIAQGWQLAHRTQLVGISSVECIAAEASRRFAKGQIRIAVDAQRNEFYIADYKLDNGNYEVEAPLRLETKENLIHWASDKPKEFFLVGPDVDKWFPEGTVIAPGAETLARLTPDRANAPLMPGEMLEPIYLREVQFVKAPPPKEIPTG